MDLEKDPETKAALDELLAGGGPTTELVTSEGQEVPAPRTIAAPSPTSAGTVAAVTEEGRQQLAPELDGRQPSVHSAALVGGNLLKAKEERAAVSPSRVMRAAAEKHKVEARGLREDLAQAERKINDLIEKQALAQERMKDELEMARAADVKKLMGELDTAVENAATAQREAHAFEAELGEVRDLLAKTESNRALEAVGQWAANTNVDGADGGGETKKEGRASSRCSSAEERNPDPLGTRAPSTLESRKLMVQGFVRSTN